MLPSQVTSIFSALLSLILNQVPGQFCCAWDLKGALDNFSLIPHFFFKSIEIFFNHKSVYVCSDSMLSLTCNFNLVTKIFEFFLAVAISKSRLLKMAATIMTVEFGTIHHYSSLEENSEAFLCNSMNRYKIKLNII